MVKINNGGAAFPKTASAFTNNNGDNVIMDHGAEGMSLRDYFAAAALQGLIAHEDSESSERAIHRTITDRKISIFSLFSESAYKYADAMIAVRNSITKE